MSASLAYRTYGDDANPPLCFLHGFMGSSADWQPVVDDLTDGYFCIVIDLPGHGASTGRDAEAYTMDAAVRAVNGVLNAVECGPVGLLGYSMGGRVALRVALRSPDRVRRLVLESVSPGIADASARAERRRTDDERARKIEADLPGFLRQWYRMPLFASLGRHGLVESMVQQRANNDPAEIARALQGFSPGRQSPLWNDLSDLAMPTLLLTGALDPKYPDVTARSAERIPDARRVLVPDAGHNVHAERPAAYRQAVKDFLDAG
jgi:2-succinyl-6-hydroxy-2,4-cyclohexadiene-1-carboxylate synthase